MLSIALGGKVPLWYNDDSEIRIPLSSRKSEVDGSFLLGRSVCFPSLAMCPERSATATVEGPSATRRSMY